MSGSEFEDHKVLHGGENPSGSGEDHTDLELQSPPPPKKNGISDILRQLDSGLSRRQLSRRLSSSRGGSLSPLNRSPIREFHDVLGDWTPPEWVLLLIGCLLRLATGVCVATFNRGVGPGEVDDELEDEVASECTKYGMVTRVLTFEITEPNFPAEEAVRIFVRFERSEETTKTLIDLNGHFFGGRVVRAGFYEEKMFEANELAPAPGEIPDFS